VIEIQSYEYKSLLLITDLQTVTPCHDTLGRESNTSRQAGDEFIKQWMSGFVVKWVPVSGSY
jgi:hypothetical protein